MAEITVGDFVRIGDSILTWRVIGIPELRQTWATLESGQTGRLRIEPLVNLTLHRKGTA